MWVMTALTIATTMPAAAAARSLTGESSARCDALPPATAVPHIRVPIRPLPLRRLLCTFGCFKACRSGGVVVESLGAFADDAAADESFQ